MKYKLNIYIEWLYKSVGFLGACILGIAIGSFAIEHIVELIVKL